MAEATKPENRLWIRDVRIAYAPGIFEARAQKQADGSMGKPKYGAAFIFPATHPCVKDIADFTVKAAKGTWGDKADEMLKMLKAGDKLPVHSGDAKATSAGYAGNLYLNAGNASRPMVLNRDKTTVAAADGIIYSGCYVNVLVEVWGQNNPNYPKRINASLLGVQFVRDGERLAGGSVASADDFEALPGSTDAPAAADASSLFN